MAKRWSRAGFVKLVITCRRPVECPPALPSRFYPAGAVYPVGGIVNASPWRESPSSIRNGRKPPQWMRVVIWATRVNLGSRGTRRERKHSRHSTRWCPSPFHLGLTGLLSKGTGARCKGGSSSANKTRPLSCPTMVAHLSIQEGSLETTPPG